MPLPFQVEDRVDHVLQGARARHRAVLRDVADQEDGKATLLREPEEPEPALPHLRHTARRRVERSQVERLDGVDDEERRTEPRDLLEDAFEVDLGLHPEAVQTSAERQALGAELHLARRLLARDVEHRSLRASERGRELERERGLPDAGVAADQDERAGHEPAAEHTVQLADAAHPPRLRARIDLIEFERCGDGIGRRTVAGAARGGGLAPSRTFARAVPRVAVRTASKPLRTLVAALGAEEHGLRLARLGGLPGCHGGESRTKRGVLRRRSD